jgi:CheY-like chemotaxis protein
MATPGQQPILVVDDDEAFRTALVGELVRQGFNVLEASNGYGALAAMRSGECPSLVVLDLWMPEMDGWQLRHRMQKEGFSDVPIVVMTAAQSQRPSALDVAEVLEKPFPMSRLIEAIRRHV